MTQTAFGGPTMKSDIPRSGWLWGIDLNFAGTVGYTASAATGGFGAYPVNPYSLIKNIRLYTNTGTEIFNMSGYGLYLYNLIYRSGRLSNTTPYGYAGTTNVPGMMTQLPASASATTHSYATAGSLELPVATDDALGLGALFLQSDQ